MKGDSAVTLCPYFKFNAGKAEEWKANAETFYEKTKTEDLMMYYGFSYEGERAHCRECYTDAKGLFAHLDNVGETFGKSLTMSSLERIECHAPAEQMEELKAHKVLQSVKTEFWTLDGKGTRKHRARKVDDTVSLHPYFKLKSGKTMEDAKKFIELFYEKTAKEKKCLFYGFSTTEDGQMFCREGYTDAKGLFEHLENVGETFGNVLKEVADLTRIECHAPEAEMADLKANEVLKSVNCEFWTLDGKGIKKMPKIPTPLKKPKFVSVEKLAPEKRGVNVFVKVVSSKAVEEAADLHEVVVGDDTAVVTLRARGEQVATCAVGKILRIQNGRIVMVKGHMRLDVDKWGVVKPAPDHEDMDPKISKDLSATEYELSK